MPKRSWIRNVFTRPIRKVPHRARLAVEALEDRVVPVTFAPPIFVPPPPPPFTEGLWAQHSVAVGDLDGDGRPDLAVTNSFYDGVNFYDRVHIRLGNGNGTFALGNFYDTGDGPTSVAVADLGTLPVQDLAVTDFNSGTVSVLHGTGNGTFFDRVPYAVGNGPFSVAVGDFNGDGRQDLATANFLSFNVSVLLGNANGTFQSAVHYAVGSAPSSVAVGDFNGDGRRDLATANSSSANVSVLLGNGNGTFASAVNYGAGSSPGSVVVADFNGDGKQDLAVGNSFPPPYRANVSVLLGNGNGTFQSPARFSNGSGGTMVAVGDFNGDTRPDLVVTNEGQAMPSGAPAGTVSVLLNLDANRAPTIARNQAAVTTNEGTQATNTGTFDDADGRPTVTLTASLGTVTKNDAAGTWSWSYTPPDGPAGPTTVTVTATDNVGLTAATTFTLTVHNVTPTITTFTVPASGAEGSPVNLSAAATDPAGGLDPLTFTWAVTRPDGTPFATLSGASASFTPPDNGSYGVSLTVSDGDGGRTVAPAPAGLLSWWRGEGNADDFVGATGSLSGGVTFAAGRVGQAFNFDGVDDHVRLPDNFLPYPATGTSTIPLSFETWFRTTSGGVILSQQSPNVSGHVPAVYVGTDGRLRAQMFWKGAIGPVVSGSPVNNGQFHHVAVVHDGAAQTVYLDGVSIGTSPHTQVGYSGTYEYRLGTGHVSSGWPAIPGTGAYAFGGLVDEPAFYNRALSAADVQAIVNAGSIGKFTPVAVAVANVAPTIATFTVPATGSTGSPVNLNATATDPAGAADPLTFTWTVTRPDSSTFTLSGASVSFTPASSGTYGVSLTVSDSDGGTATRSGSVAVVSPAGSIAGVVYNDLNGDGIRQAEPGLPNWTVYLDLSNNGTRDTTEPSVQSDSAGRYAFPNLAPATYTVREVPQANWTQTAPAGGAHTVVLGAGDNVSGRDFGNQFVPPSTLQVLSFTPTNSGFTAVLSRPLDVAAVNLYDVSPPSLGPADVTVVGNTTGRVAGSLVFNAAGDTITFIRTGDLLPADTYTVTLRSAGNGFKDTMGNLLDGNADGTAGDNYTTTFTVAPSTTVVVSIPDFVRGPGQSVNVPADGTGLWVRLSDGSGITGVSLTLRYDPALLNITAVTSLVGGIVNSGGPAGQVSISYFGVLPLPAGPVDLVRLTANVPDTAPYASKHVLDITNLMVSGPGGAIPSRDDDAIHVAGYFGDTSGNGGLSAVDAQRALRRAVGLDGGFSAYRLADPRLIADISSNGRVDATDATRILQESVGLDRPELPPLPPGVTITPSGPDPLLYFPKSFRARPGATLTVPLLLEPAVGLESLDLAIAYDSRRLEVVAVERGELTADFDLFVVNADATAGTIRAGLGRTAGPIAGPSRGSVLQLRFRVREDAPAGRAIINLLHDLPPTQTLLNEGGLLLTPEPSNKAGDVLDGWVTVRKPVAPVTRVRRDGGGQGADVAGLLEVLRQTTQAPGTPAATFPPTRSREPGPSRELLLLAERTSEPRPRGVAFDGGAVDWFFAHPICELLEEFPTANSVQPSQPSTFSWLKCLVMRL